MVGCDCSGFQACTNKVLSDWAPYSFVPNATQPKLQSYTRHCGWSFKCNRRTCTWYNDCTADDQPTAQLFHTAYVYTLEDCDGDPSQK